MTWRMSPRPAGCAIGAKTSATSRARMSRSRIGHPDRPQEEEAEQDLDREDRRVGHQRGIGIGERCAFLAPIAGSIGHGRSRPGARLGRSCRAAQTGSPGRGPPRASGAGRVRRPSRCPRRSAGSRSSSRSRRSRRPAPGGHRRDRCRRTRPMSSFTKSGRSSRMWRKLREAGAGVVHGDPDLAADARHGRAERAVVLDRDVLGHLEHGRPALGSQAVAAAAGRSSSRSGEHIQAQPAGPGRSRRRREGGGQAGRLELQAEAHGAASAKRRSGRVPSSNLVSASWPTVGPTPDRRSAGRPARTRCCSSTASSSPRTSPRRCRARIPGASSADATAPKDSRTGSRPARKVMPSTASVQTTIAPSIAVLVRRGMIAIAVGASLGTRRSVDPKPASHGPTHGPAPTRSAHPTVRPRGRGTVHPDADVDGLVASEGHGLPGRVEGDDEHHRQAGHPAQLVADRPGRSPLRSRALRGDSTPRPARPTAAPDRRASGWSSRPGRRGRYCAGEALRGADASRGGSRTRSSTSAGSKGLVR